MIARRAFAIVLVVAAVLALAWLWRRVPDAPSGTPGNPVAITKAAADAKTVAHSTTAAGQPPATVTSRAAKPLVEGESHVADDLNAPGGTIQRDLGILDEVFAMWRTNFPHDGNPVGENAEITAALRGENPVRFAFLPRGHRAVNSNGELCDRWGTPFRFHQLSGSRMEIRSAGPDRKFATADDVALSPP